MIKIINATREGRARDKKRQRKILVVPYQKATTRGWQSGKLMFHLSEREEQQMRRALAVNTVPVFNALRELLKRAEKQLDQSASHEGIGNCVAIAGARNALRVSGPHTISKPVKKNGEWIVKWMTNGKRDENKTYYTDDKKDAWDTYALMTETANFRNVEAK